MIQNTLRLQSQLSFSIASCLLLLAVFLFSKTSEAQTELWGMTSEGGEDNIGTIFKTDSTGANAKAVFSFENLYPGANPWSDLIEVSGVKLYGVTYSGGLTNQGVLFEYNPSTKTYLKKYDFEGSDGEKPWGGLVEADNEKLYGMTYGGGVNNQGVLFEYDPVSGVYLKKLDFNDSIGRRPRGSLIQANNGKLYGMTWVGGEFNGGVLFEYDPVLDVYAKKIDFNDSTGRAPTGSLVQATNGKLYGMTRLGGSNNDGALFEYDILTGVYEKLVDFSDTAGSNPEGSLIEVSEGKLFGVTNGGGSSNNGVLFEYNLVSGMYSNKVDFNDLYGKYPKGSLVQTDNGKLYGMTSNGGGVFEYDMRLETIKTVVNFNGINGQFPTGSLSKSSDGKLYGMTFFGGSKGEGVLFQFDPESVKYQKELDFNRSNGSQPFGSLMRANNGKLFGMTRYGGKRDLGVLFQYDPANNEYEVKVDFNDSIGTNPYGSLVQASNSKIYGMTYSGGSQNVGVLFEFDPSTGQYSKKVDFDLTIGANPWGSLIEASDSNLYGMTWVGGNNGVGVLFKYNPRTDMYSKEYDFDPYTGARPRGTLMEASNGKLYGMTISGGIGNGVLFEYDPYTNNYLKKHDFTFVNGEPARGRLVEGGTGIVYGMTYNGGTNDEGQLFEYNLNTNTFSSKVNFKKTNNGRNPFGGLMKRKGKIYGMTSAGGDNGYGVVFEYNPLRDTLEVRSNFNGENGGRPYYGILVEVQRNKLFDDAISWVSDSSWRLSTVVTTATANSYPWPGVATVPNAATFTEPVMVGQPYPWEHLWTINGSEVITSLSGVTYYRKTFDLIDHTNLNVRLRMYVDDNMQVFINGQWVAMEDDMGPDVWRGAGRDLLFKDDGTVENGYSGGTPWSYVTTEDIENILQTGTNDIVLAIRNRSNRPDRGGFSFRMDIDQNGAGVIVKSADATPSVASNEGALNIDIYPNPTNGILNIVPESVDKDQTMEVILFDINGRIVKSMSYDSPFAGEAVTMDLSNLAKGVYSLRVESGNEFTVERIILN